MCALQPEGAATWGLWDSPAWGFGAQGAVTKELFSRTAWEGRRNRVKAPYAKSSSPRERVPE